MTLNKIKKIIAGTALASVVAFSAAASACTIETAHPKARITFEFDSKEYVVDYTLYRNMYPQTVRHFIELSREGFYDNTVIHDYTSGDWFTGGYSYNAEQYAQYSSGGDTMADYFAENSKENLYYSLFNDGKLTPSVYSNTDFKKDKNGNIVYEDNNPVRVINNKFALPTLMGEFTNNIKQVITNGALSAEIGCLKMFYYKKESKSKVYVTPTSDQIIQADYKNNCATSVFSVQVGTSSYSATEYCVFAQADDIDDLTDFTKAVNDYYDNTYGSDNSGYTVESTVFVDTNESFSTEEGDKNTERKFKAPKTPIIIKSVKITKN